MWVHVTADGLSLEQPGDTRTLKVVAPADTAAEELDARLREPGLGRFEAESGYAWLSVEALRARSVVPDGAGADDFDAMMAYAAESGWIDGGELRSLVQFAIVPRPADFSRASTEQRAKWWRSVLGEYPTGVAIVSALDTDGNPQGLVVGTFSSVSLDPPLVSFMPMRTSRSYTAVADCTHFRVSVLGARHEDLCRSFATAPPDRRFEVGNWVFDDRGIPQLADALVWFDCERTQTIPAGDHDIVLGAVQDLGYGDENAGMPMLFLKGGYGSFTMPTLEFDAHHLGSHLRAAQQSSHLITQLAEELDDVVSLCSLAQDKVVVLTAANLQRDDASGGVGSTYPFASPLGLVFAAWNHGNRAAMWRKAGRELGFDADDVLDRMTARVRELGYAIGVGPVAAEEFVRIALDPSQGPEPLRDLWRGVVHDYVALAEADGWAKHVSSLQFPVFGPTGEPDLALVVSVAPTGLTEDELDYVVARCQYVAHQLSENILSARRAEGL